MDNLIQNEAEMKELNRAKSFGSTKVAEIKERPSMSVKDPDTMLSMTVLLFACLALAVLAHVFV
jgi:hypothetical protein